MRRHVGLLLLGIILLAAHESPSRASAYFSFAVASDMRIYAGDGAYNTCHYFRGACETILRESPTAFLLSAGDIDPVGAVHWTIWDVFGSQYLWYPVVGNHELPDAGNEATSGANMQWLRTYNYDANGPGVWPDLVNHGPSGCPETTFSFDAGDAHFVVLNEYCDVTGDAATDGDISDHLYDWLAEDLAATAQPYRFVIGHEPAYPQPDAENGRLQHVGDSLDKYPERRDRFWALLRQQRVLAYFCGHTHNYSAVRIGGVWQIDSGHARGSGDSGARSTFLIVEIHDRVLTFKTYRAALDNTCRYTLTQQWQILPNALQLARFSGRAGWWAGTVPLLLAGWLFKRKSEVR